MQSIPHSACKINARILKLALPAIFSNITVPLLGLSDTFISGHLGSEVYLAAIAVGTMLVNSLYWLFGFLRMGTTGLTAEAFGSGDPARRQRIFTSAFILAFSLGAILMLFSHPLSRLQLWIMHPSEATASLGAEYFNLSILSAPAFLATMAVTGWMIGMQNTLFPMIISVGVNVVNISLSFTLVYWCGLGFKGVALGTCIANWCGLGAALLFAMRLCRDARLFAPLRELRGKMDFRRFFRVNSDLMMRSACVMAVLFAMTSFGGRMGDHVLAVNAILMQFFMFFSYFMDGFAFSGEALCGLYAGAGDRTGIRHTVYGILLWATTMTAIFFTVYYTLLEPITHALTDKESVAASVAAMKWVACAIPPVSAAAFIFDGVYIGITATRRLLVTTLLAAVLFFLIMAPYVAGYHDMLHISPASQLWTAFLAFLLLRGVLLAALLRGTLRQRFTY